MKRFLSGPWLILALWALPLTRGAGVQTEKTPVAVAAGHFIQPAVIDWKAALPPPPAPGSVAALGDLETVLQVQAARTPADIAWAKLIEQDDVYADYGDILGTWFAEKNLPGLADFIRQITADAQIVNRRVKDLYPRSRPPAVEPAVQPCVDIPTSNSYPSGHSLRAYVWAAVLGDIFPDRQVELNARGRHVAWGRVIGGVHFPTDTIGGRLTAQAFITELRKNPEYRAMIEKCRAEAAPFRLKPAA